jgi:hypothetical protein
LVLCCPSCGGQPRLQSCFILCGDRSGRTNIARIIVCNDEPTLSGGSCTRYSAALPVRSVLGLNSVRGIVIFNASFLRSHSSYNYPHARVVISVCNGLKPEIFK